jgi:7-cyano-7-deazaguanine synthase
MTTVVPSGGGLDSAVLLAEVADAVALFVDHGQRPARREWRATRRLAAHYGRPAYRLDFRAYGRILGLPDRVPLTFPDAFVANRDAFLADVAVVFAMAHGADRVALGTVGSDAYGATDRAFLDAFNRAVAISNDGYDPPVVDAPLLSLTKPAVVRLAVAGRIPIAATWTCWDSRRPVCTRCAKCAARLDAFDTVGADDPLDPRRKERR